MKPNETRSTGQGVGGNPESEGPQGKPTGPRQTNRQPAPPQGRPSCLAGKPCAADGGGVSDASMSVLGSHGDLGKHSVLRTAGVWDAPVLGHWWQKARTAGAVDLVATRGRRDQGGRGSRRSRDAGGNLGRAKGSWSTEAPAEETSKVTSRGRERNGGDTHLVLYEEPPREGEGAERPSGWSSAVGDRGP